MSDMELAIREHAYHLWQAAGSPEGNSDAFWLAAQREILVISLGALGNVTVANPDAQSAKVVKKPVKAKTVVTSAKAKRRVA